MTAPRTPDFDARAATYDALRPTDESWWRLFDVLVEEADLRGRKVLDVGCGTGKLVAALAERAYARAWGVDASEEMVRVARAGAPPGVGLKVGRAEALPFRDGSFERVTMRHVVHLLDRPRAFAEAARVLGAEGRLAIATFAHEHFHGYWLNPWFPSIAELDRARFPTEDELREELRSAGLGTVAAVRVSSVQELDRETALARVRGRHISTFDLLSDREIVEGTRRAEAELPARISAPLEQLLVVARTAAEHDQSGTNSIRVEPTSSGLSIS